MPHRPHSSRAALSLALSLGAWIALLAPPFAHAQDTNPASAFLPLRGQSRALFETRDGRLLRARPIGIFGDSLWLERPVARFTNGRFRLAMADVTHAYVHRKNPRTMAITQGVTGAAGGALLELGLGSRHEGFGSDAKHLLVAAGVNGAVRAGVGALIGILFPAWTQAVPPPEGASGAALEPFPAWSVSALGGGSHPSLEFQSSFVPALTIASWKNMGPHFSWGYEFGTLSHASDHYVQPAVLAGGYYLPAFTDDREYRWAYSTLQFRVRLLRQGVRPLLTFGLGSYAQGFPFRETVTDSTGAVTRYQGRDVSSASGANAGLGLTWGRGPTHPEIEVRYHTAGDSGHWLTVQAGMIYQ